MNLNKKVIISHPIMVSDTVERKFSKAEEGPELEKKKKKKRLEAVLVLGSGPMTSPFDPVPTSHRKCFLPP